MLRTNIGRFMAVAAVLFIVGGIVVYKALETSPQTQVAAQEVAAIRAETAKLAGEWQAAIEPTCSQFERVQQRRDVVLSDETISTLTKACHR